MTATVANPTTSKRPRKSAEEKERLLTLAAAKKVLERRKMREWALASTVNFSRLVGVNPYNFRKQEIKYDPDTGFYPWCPYAEKAAAYFEKPGVSTDGHAIAKPKYIVFIARDHIS